MLFRSSQSSLRKRYVAIGASLLAVGSIDEDSTRGAGRPIGVEVLMLVARAASGALSCDWRMRISGRRSQAARPAHVATSGARR